MCQGRGWRKGPGATVFLAEDPGVLAWPGGARCRLERGSRQVGGSLCRVSPPRGGAGCVRNSFSCHRVEWSCLQQAGGC